MRGLSSTPLAHNFGRNERREIRENTARCIFDEGLGISDWDWGLGLQIGVGGLGYVLLRMLDISFNFHVNRENLQIAIHFSS